MFFFLKKHKSYPLPVWFVCPCHTIFFAVGSAPALICAVRLLSPRPSISYLLFSLWLLGPTCQLSFLGNAPLLICSFFLSHISFRLSRVTEAEMEPEAEGLSDLPSSMSYPSIFLSDIVDPVFVVLIVVWFLPFWFYFCFSGVRRRRRRKEGRCCSPGRAAPRSKSGGVVGWSHSSTFCRSAASTSSSATIRSRPRPVPCRSIWSLRSWADSVGNFCGGGADRGEVPKGRAQIFFR